MKTKIIYISGSEIFDMADIRSAFEEVRSALNLDKDTVLFGVPVDADDAGLEATKDNELTSAIAETIDITAVPESIEPTEIQEPEPVVEKTIKKRTSSRKKTTEESTETKVETETSETTDEAVEKIVPILSILSVNNEDSVEPAEQETTENIEIIEDVVQETTVTEEETPEESAEEQTNEESGLDELLSSMTPLEDIVPEPEEHTEEEIIIDTDNTKDEENIDETLKQLATEFVKKQDSMPSTKSSGNGRLGKLRKYLPFKPQTKKEDPGLDNLFDWAGSAANDEDFSVPGFFTNIASKK
ncbi:MAG: hypothetical protein J6W27_04790 [Alphaproteobacteria bacterium]|nr:hypothetical protein [Alphaproteobacteria bacterium]